MIRSGDGTDPIGTSSPTAPVKCWPLRSSNATRTWASTPDGSNPRSDLPATTSTLPMGSMHSTITASRRSCACSRSSSCAAGGFFPVGMQRWWIYRLTFQNSARGRSKDFGCESQSNSFMTHCPARATFSTGSAISNAASPRQLLVLHAMRDDGILPEPAHLVFFVVRETAFEPFDMAVAFEGQDMRGDAVGEPAVMDDDHGAAGEILQYPRTPKPAVISPPP